MTKDQILEGVREAAAAGAVSRDDVLSAYDEGAGSKEAGKKHAGIEDILYFIGGGVVVLGISILVGQNWSALGVPARVLVTFGAGVAAYISGVLLGRTERLAKVGTAFHLIAALLIPFGIGIIVDAAGISVADPWFQVLDSGLLFAVYLASFFVFRRDLFLLFTLVFGTWFFFALTGHLMNEQAYSFDWQRKFFEYRALLTGLAYILLGHSFSRAGRASLTGPLYAFGSLGFLGGAFALGGFGSQQIAFWEMAFPVLVFSVLFASVHLKSKAFLVFGTFFLMAFILKITAEYFSEGFGWPIALVLAGFLMIGAGYLSLWLRRQQAGA